MAEIELEGRIGSLLGGWRYLRQRLKAADSKRVNSRDRVELFVRKINESKEIFR